MRRQCVGPLATRERGSLVRIAKSRIPRYLTDEIVRLVLDCLPLRFNCHLSQRARVAGRGSWGSARVRLQSGIALNAKPAVVRNRMDIARAPVRKSLKSIPQKALR